MRKLFLNIILGFLFCSSCFGQKVSMSVYSRTMIDTTTYNYGGIWESNFEHFVDFNLSEKLKLVESISNSIKDSSDYFTGIPIRNRKLISEGEIAFQVDGFEYSMGLQQPNSYSNDSVGFIEYCVTLDENGEPIYDDEGWEVYEDIEMKYFLGDVLSEVDSYENWELGDSEFKKTSFYYAFYGCRLNEANEPRLVDFFSIIPEEKLTKDKNIFLKKVTYDHFFFPYRKFASIPDSDIEMPELNTLGLVEVMDPGLAKELLLKDFDHLSGGGWVKSKPNYFDNFLSELIGKVLDGSCGAQHLGTNENIELKNRKFLFMESYFVDKLDEEGEPMYDDQGKAVRMKIDKSYEFNDIVGLRFNEDWYLAKNQFDIVKQVNSVSILVKNYNANGTLEPEPKVLPFKIIFDN
jgi:hypothetical protein